MKLLWSLSIMPNGSVVLGTSAKVTAFGSANAQIVGDTTVSINQSTALIAGFGGVAGGALELFRNNDVIGSGTVDPSLNDIAGTVRFTENSSVGGAQEVAKITAVAEAVSAGQLDRGALVIATQQTSLSAATEAARFRGDGSFWVGSSAGAAVTASQQSMCAASASTNQPGVLAARYSNDNTNPPVVVFFKSRGATLNSNVATTSGDQLGSNDFYGCNSSNQAFIAAQIRAITDGTPGSRVPGRIELLTGTASAAPVIAATIDRDGSFQSSSLVQSQMAPAGNITMGAGCCAVVSGNFKVAAGKNLTLGAGAILHVL